MGVFGRCGLCDFGVLGFAGSGVGWLLVPAWCGRFDLGTPDSTLCRAKKGRIEALGPTKFKGRIPQVKSATVLGPGLTAGSVVGRRGRRGVWMLVRVPVGAMVGLVG